MTKQILLIDDDQDEAELFKEAVKEVDRTAIFNYISNCAEAIRQLKNNLLPVPSFIFLDIKMPVQSGLDCLEDLKKTINTKRVPIIVYSNSRRTDDINKAMNLGAWAFWTKPKEYWELPKKLKNLIQSVLFP